jgi:hypothetical protein
MAINEKAIVDALSKMAIVGNEEGLIPAFGVYLTNMYTDYYNDLSFELEREMQSAGLAPVVGTLLIDAALQCGYNTFHGISTSAEWKALIEPMIEKREDILYGMAAVTNALGWGRVSIVEIVPNEKLVIQMPKNYESEGYLQKYGRAESGKCYMWAGVASAWMDLVYGKPYPDGMYTFEAKEVKCRAKGDPYCEVVATRVKTM